MRLNQSLLKCVWFCLEYIAAEIVLQGTRVSEDKEFRKNFFAEHWDAEHCSTIETDITCYHGKLEDPGWRDTEPGMHLLWCRLLLKHTHETAELFSPLCTVKADTSMMAKALVPKYGLRGERYYRQDFSVVLLFGLTELKAQISWIEDVSLIIVYLCHILTTLIREKKRGKPSAIPPSACLTFAPPRRSPAKVVYDLDTIVAHSD